MAGKVMPGHIHDLALGPHPGDGILDQPQHQKQVGIVLPEQRAQVPARIPERIAQPVEPQLIGRTVPVRGGIHDSEQTEDAVETLTVLLQMAHDQMAG